MNMICCVSYVPASSISGKSHNYEYVMLKFYSKQIRDCRKGEISIQTQMRGNGAGIWAEHCNAAINDVSGRLKNYSDTKRLANKRRKCAANANDKFESRNSWLSEKEIKKSETRNRAMFIVAYERNRSSGSGQTDWKAKVAAVARNAEVHFHFFRFFLFHVNLCSFLFNTTTSY